MTTTGSGRRIQNARKAKGISASQLSRLVGVTPAAVSNWETKDAKPRAELLAATANALGVSPKYLLTGSDVPAASSSETKETVASILDVARKKLAQASGVPLKRVKLNLHFEIE